MALMLNNEHVKKHQKSEKERIELVVEFGKSFDGFLVALDARGMMTLAAWAKVNGLPDCGTQAYRAATALASGLPVQIRTIAVLVGSGGNR